MKALNKYSKKINAKFFKCYNSEEYLDILAFYITMQTSFEMEYCRNKYRLMTGQFFIRLNGGD